MPSIHFRCEDWLKEGMEEVCGEAGIDVSEMARQACTEMLMEWEEQLPSWIRKEASHSDMVKRNNPELRAMHFKQRVFDYAKDTLTNDEGRIARYPPEPEKMESRYFEMLTEELEKEIPEEWQEEFEEHIAEVMDWYEVMHPNSEYGSPAQEAKALAEWHYRHGRKKTARQILREADEDGVLGREVSYHDAMDDIREGAAQERWMDDWDDAIRT